jgi:hypothetical protein
VTSAEEFTRHWRSAKPSKATASGMSAARSAASNTFQQVESVCSGWRPSPAISRQRRSSQTFSSAIVLNRALGVKSHSRTLPTWFSTRPFSQPAAGVQAVGSMR